MVTLEPRAKFPPPAHNTHPELYVVGFLCIVCLARPAAPQLFKKSRARAAFEPPSQVALGCMFVDTRQRMSIRKKTFGEKLA